MTTSPAPVGSATSTSFNRIAAISGIVFIVCVILSLVLVGDMPSSSDDASTISDYLTENPGTHKAGLLMITFALVPASLFLAGLVGAHRASDQEHGEHWSIAIAAFFITALALNAVGVAIDAGLVLSKDADLSDSVLLVSWDISVATIAMMTLGFGGTALSVGIPVLLHGLRPAWYGWLSLLVGVLGVLSLGTAVSDSDGVMALGFPIFPAFIVWVIATSTFIYRDA